MCRYNYRLSESAKLAKRKVVKQYNMPNTKDNKIVIGEMICDVSSAEDNLTWLKEALNERMKKGESLDEDIYFPVCPKNKENCMLKEMEMTLSFIGLFNAEIKGKEGDEQRFCLSAHISASAPIGHEDVILEFFERNEVDWKAVKSYNSLDEVFNETAEGLVEFLRQAAESLYNNSSNYYMQPNFVLKDFFVSEEKFKKHQKDTEAFSAEYVASFTCKGHSIEQKVVIDSPIDLNSYFKNLGHIYNVNSKVSVDGVPAFGLRGAYINENNAYGLSVMEIGDQTSGLYYEMLRMFYGRGGVTRTRGGALLLELTEIDGKLFSGKKHPEINASLLYVACDTIQDVLPLNPRGCCDTTLLLEEHEFARRMETAEEGPFMILGTNSKKYSTIEKGFYGSGNVGAEIQDAITSRCVKTADGRLQVL